MNQPITDAVSAFRMPTESSSPRRSIREGELEPHTAHHNAAIDIEGAESLMSLHQQQQATTHVDEVEEDWESVKTQRSRNRDKKRKRIDNHGREAEQTLSKLEREEVHVEGVIRRSMQKASLMLSEDINYLAVVDINSYMNTLSRLFRALEALQSTD
ncbi:uncharacterized protein PV09_09759 [Verruconis gallopava]|uniref:Uncharacterized protein n=1 Tax=Verruconis gallopava TaxID=253628 RepID=A0A0D1ZVB0_9PEZI|nr:uncharacterized protein PV09_09759 [Verruconis gallopava]KIV98427.1 hypothetical protein PV09_09759 [Verruconis gallopava]